MQEASENYLFGVILAGGSGSRLWPVSRELYPKHFLKFFGEETLLQATVSRIQKIVPPQNTIIVTNEKFLPDVKNQLDDFHGSREKKDSLQEKVITEPLGRNTAPAIGLAAFHLYDQDPESIMIVSPSDHLINNDEAFLKTIKYGISAAKKGFLVTFGATPNYPETGYGYMKKGEMIDQKIGENNESLETYLVERFFEKPDLETAKDYLDNGSYLWNLGIFAWKTKEILRAIKIHLPDLYPALEKIYEFSKSQEDSQKIEDIYKEIKPVSIDKGVLEKSDKVVVVPSDIEWNDVGSWDKIHQILPKDQQGNFIDKKSLQIDCENSMIFGADRIIASVGLKDIIIVDTEDALLVCHKEKAQQVKDVFDDLKSKKSSETLRPRTIKCPWGNWSLLLEGPGYKIKKIIVLPGQSLSLQLHKHRSEHWIVVGGQAEVVCGGKTINLKKNQSIFIPENEKHRVSNKGEENLEIIEVQNGDYLEEDDIIRLEDEYGRA